MNYSINIKSIIGRTETIVGSECVPPLPSINISIPIKYYSLSIISLRSWKKDIPDMDLCCIGIIIFGVTIPCFEPVQ